MKTQFISFFNNAFIIFFRADGAWYKLLMKIVLKEGCLKKINQAIF